MTPDEILIFLAAGLVGGVVNAAAGGAKLFVFPMLVATGIPPVAANATSTVAVWPAQLPAAWVYRRELLRRPRLVLMRMLPVLAGTLIGALALINSSDAAFLVVVPPLLVLAAGAILFGNRLSDLLRRLVPDRRLQPLSGVLLFACGLYGGFFGAGVGFMFLAVLSLVEDEGFGTANAQKNLIAFAMNTLAVGPLAYSGLVHWAAAGSVLLGGLAGGYLGARLTRLLPDTLMRALVAGMGLVLTAAFLIRHGAG